jgi:tRNA-dihydrouridine synthase A
MGGIGCHERKNSLKNSLKYLWVFDSSIPATITLLHPGPWLRVPVKCGLNPLTPSPTLKIPLPPRRLSVAPMMDWTDRHCRMFHRQITRHTWLYTEMVTTGAIIHGDKARHLDFSDEEHPVALQLGGSEPADLAISARFGEQWGYDEINLNCGCPSERVQRGAFGACLMAEPALVADSVKAMRDAVSIDVTVKHRIGIDEIDSYDFVRDFVGTVAEAGCRTFIVHARNAILKGLTPKENREIPPLRYERAYQLKRDFPQLEIIINGGIKSLHEIDVHLQHVDGVMIGREAYHNPYLMAAFDGRYYGDAVAPLSRHEIIDAILPYIREQLDREGPRLNSITRHMLGLMAGLPGARSFRQRLSDAKQLASGDPDILRQAAQAVLGADAVTRPSTVD